MTDNIGTDQIARWTERSAHRVEGGRPAYRNRAMEVKLDIHCSRGHCDNLGGLEDLIGFSWASCCHFSTPCYKISVSSCHFLQWVAEEVCWVAAGWHLTI